MEGQLGLEQTPEEYVAKLVEIFREVKRVLKKEGTAWLNLGDSYAGSNNGSNDYRDAKSAISKNDKKYKGQKPGLPTGLKPKDLVGIPWRVAFALQADGWYLRQDIIWHKPNPMPESVTDRCTKSHEYIFLLAKNQKYYFDNEAIKEDSVDPESYEGRNKRNPYKGVGMEGFEVRGGFSEIEIGKTYEKRNKRSVWTITTKPYAEAHFATYPPDLITPMILAGCPKDVCKKCGKGRERIMERQTPSDWEFRKTKGAIGGSMIEGGKQQIGSGWSHDLASADLKEVGWSDCGCNAGWEKGIVLDPFMGAGTTALVAKQAGRNYLGIELNPAYIEIANKRLNQQTLDI